MKQTAFAHLTTGLFVQKEWDIDGNFDLILKFGPTAHYFWDTEATKLRAYLDAYKIPVKQQSRTSKRA
jgi:hypothetical protein